MHFRLIGFLLLLPLLSACGGVDVAGILGQSGDDNTSTASVAVAEVPASSDEVTLDRSIGTGLLSINYPGDWFADANEGGINLASDEETLDRIVNTESDAVPQLADGAMALVINLLPFAVDQGSPAALFDLVFSEPLEDDPFTPGEREDAMIGEFAGVTSSLSFREDVSGEGVIYILRFNDNSVLLAIGIGAVDSYDEALAARILGSARLFGAAPAVDVEPTAIVVPTLPPPTPVVEPTALPTFTPEAGVDAPVEIIPLTETFSANGVTVSLPDGWVAEYDETDGYVIASSEQALAGYDSSSEPNFEEIGEGNIVVAVQLVPFGVDFGTSRDFFNTIVDSISGEDGIEIGDARDIPLGDYSGIVAPLTLSDAVGTGVIDLYVLRFDDETVGLGLAIAAADMIPAGLAEAILASFVFENDGEDSAEEPAVEPTEMGTEPTETAVEPTEVAADPVDGIALDASFNDGGFAFNYPGSWIARYDPNSGIVVASSQLVLDEFDNSDAPNFDLLGDGAVVISMTPVPAAAGTPREILDVFTSGIEEGDDFVPGEPEDIEIGGLTGIRAPVTFGGNTVGVGSGDMYILRLDEARILLIISVTSGVEPPRAVTEGIVATLGISP